MCAGVALQSGLCHGVCWPFRAGSTKKITERGKPERKEEDYEMDAGERTTGTSDEHYNLIAVLYHALQGAETIEAYILDAEAAGDERLADFFQEAQDTYRRMAERAKAMLGILEVPPEPEVMPDVPPDTMSGGIPLRSDKVRMPAEEVPPDSVPDVPPPGETPGEPGRATPERQAAQRTDEQQEEKSLIDKVEDKLTDR
jgi:hypothetical protein